MTETRSGTLLAGRYRLGGALGRGGMAVVHRADDVVLERQVAVKVFEPEAAEPGRAWSYEQEARILAGLSHPGLVTVFDAGIDATGADGSRAFLVMELVHGATLADVLSDGPLSPPQVAHLGAQLATALSYVHRKGVVHRDVKPANILLRDAEDDDPVPGARALLTDFGIARLVDSARLTAEGLALGTASYLSPEQVSGGDIGAPTDVYSLGLLLLECLTGEVVFPGEGFAGATERLKRDPQPPAWLDGQWTRLLCSMLERDPSARPAAAEVAVALTGLAAVPGATPPPQDASTTTALPTVFDEPAPRMPSAASGAQHTRVMQLPAAPRRRPRSDVVRRVPRRVIALLAAAVLLALLVLVFVLATRGPSTGPGPAPNYPSVPGKLGTDLQKLERQVQP